MPTLALYNDYPFPVPINGQWTPWNPFIIVSTIIFVLFIFPLYFYFGKKARTNNKYKTLVPFFTDLFLIFTEIYKQILVTYHYNWEYHYFIFPFQLCAMPMYISFLIPFIKNDKIKDSFISFMAQYSMIGGLAVILYQQSVLTWEDYSLNVHTIIWHLILISIGVFSATYTNFGNFNYKEMVKKYTSGSIVFVIVVIIAEILNLLIVLNHGYNEYTDGGNLFYISMFMYNLNIPILKTILAKLGWYVGFIGYTFVLLLGGFVLSNVYYLISKVKVKHFKSLTLKKNNN